MLCFCTFSLGGKGEKQLVFSLQLVRVSPALSHSVEDGGVAEDDGNAGQQKSKDEEKLLGRLPVLLEDGAGEGGLVKTQLSPELEQGRKDHAEGKHPDTEYHEDDIGLAVDVVVPAVVGYQDVSVDSDGHHVHQGAGHVTIKEEREDSA